MYLKLSNILFGSSYLKSTSFSINMKQSLIIGRFQPMHLGHLYLIRKSLEESDFLIVCIGSSNKSGSENNPIKCEERERIVRKVLDSERVTNYEIVLVDDIREVGRAC
jgi:nicotinamide-nucleotide adenylyltransferase